MTICKFCNQDVPHLELLQHFNKEHPKEMAEARRKGGSATAKLRKEKGGARQQQQPPKADAAVQAALVDKGAEEQHQEEQPQKKEHKPSGQVGATEQIKGRFITKVIDLPGDLLVLYWLAKAAFPEYVATEGEWIADCINQFYAEHSEQLGLNKLFDKTYKVVPVGAAVNEARQGGE